MLCDQQVRHERASCAGSVAASARSSNAHPAAANRAPVRLLWQVYITLSDNCIKIKPQRCLDTQDMDCRLLPAAPAP